MKKIQILFAAIIIATLAITACGKKDDNGDDNKVTDPHELLYDKWWYNTGNQGRGANFFNSDGTCQMTIPPATGTWTWSVNDSLVVNMDNYPPMTLHFTEIKETTMEYWPTFEPEGNLYQFSTTKP